MPDRYPGTHPILRSGVALGALHHTAALVAGTIRAAPGCFTTRCLPAPRGAVLAGTPW